MWHVFRLVMCVSIAVSSAVSHRVGTQVQYAGAGVGSIFWAQVFGALFVNVGRPLPGDVHSQLPIGPVTVIHPEPDMVSSVLLKLSVVPFATGFPVRRGQQTFIRPRKREDE